jgi:hypothetical protein
VAIPLSLSFRLGIYSEYLWSRLTASPRSRTQDRSAVGCTETSFQPNTVVPGLPQSSLSPEQIDRILSLSCRRFKQREILKLFEPPEHLRIPGSNVQHARFGCIVHGLVFQLLCLTSYGQQNMDNFWASIILDEIGDDSAWRDTMKNLCERLNNMNVVVSHCRHVIYSVHLPLRASRMLQ